MGDVKSRPFDNAIRDTARRLAGEMKIQGVQNVAVC
jgi:hypothetical protein